MNQEGVENLYQNIWVNVIDLRVGEILFTRDGRRVPETNVSVRLAEMKVYNLQVAQRENDAVGHSDPKSPAKGRESGVAPEETIPP